MGKYDYVDKEFVSVPKHAAELISKGFFRGKRMFLEEDILKLPGSYGSSTSESGSLERDSLFCIPKFKLKFGIEIENNTDYSMPRRIMEYDSSEYAQEAKLLRKKNREEKKLKTFQEIKSGMLKEEGYDAILNMVLYLGNGHFHGKRSLTECYNEIPESVKPYVYSKLNQYQYSLVEADYVNPEEYHTELRQFFMALQARYDKKRLMELMETEEFQGLSMETQRAIAVHLNNKKLIQKVVEEKEEMCKAMRDWEKELLEEGKEQGIEQGIQNALLSIMDTMHLSIEDAMDILKIPQAKRGKYMGL